MATVLHRGQFTIEASALPECAGRCSVTAEIFIAGHMVRACYRCVDIPPGGYAQAEKDAIADLLTWSASIIVTSDHH